MVDLIDRLYVLLEQEVRSYQTFDYLNPQFEEGLHASHHEGDTGVNEVWREKICEWSYQVVDHFEFSREIVSIAIHYLDRYLCKHAVDRRHFQLLAMGCLYLAIKLHAPSTVSINTMNQLSNGYFTADQVAEMERIILSTLDWKVHPPTPHCFAKHILFLLPNTAVSLETRYDILELARYLTELSVIDYRFVGYRPSAIAIAALLGAMEDILAVTPAAVHEIKSHMSHVPGLHPDQPEVRECRQRLLFLYRQGVDRPQVEPDNARAAVVSPVSVASSVQTVSHQEC